jgi:hypothetical protein
MELAEARREDWVYRVNRFTGCGNGATWITPTHLNEVLEEQRELVGTANPLKKSSFLTSTSK